MKWTLHLPREARWETRIARALRQVLPERARPIGYLTHLVRQHTRQRVRLGPFAGMRYVDQAIGSAYLPKLLGTYERELAPVIEEACAHRPGLVVDAGAGEGYYAVGLALRNPQAQVIAFERQPAGRAALQDLAQRNGVEGQIQVRHCCDPAGLELSLRFRRAALPRRQNSISLLVCDVEGEEQVLLDPQGVPSLASTHVLVETHEFVRPGITDELRSRFAATHQVKVIWQTERSAAEFPFRTAGTRLLPRSYLDWALSEWRPIRMCWLWMKPHE